MLAARYFGGVRVQLRAPDFKCEVVLASRVHPIRRRGLACAVIEKSSGRFLVEPPAAIKTNKVFAFGYHIGNLLALRAMERE